MISADLLDQLREKDPDLWEKIAETALSEYEYHDEEFNAWISNAITHTDLFGPAQEAWLQHCLQEAIRARGWYYSIWNTSPDSTEVIIRRGGEGYINPDFMHIGEGKNEAEALLIAYLAAI